MAGNTEYKNNWAKENLDRISLTVPKGQKGTIQKHAETQGESVTAFINRAIREAIERDNLFQQNEERIIECADKYRVSTDGMDLKKITAAIVILEEGKPNIMQSYFSWLPAKGDTKVTELGPTIPWKPKSERGKIM